MQTGQDELLEEAICRASSPVLVVSSDDQPAIQSLKGGRKMILRLDL
jgi:hypothetical protein